METERALSKDESDSLMIGIPKKSLSQAAKAYMPKDGKSHRTARDYLNAAEAALKEPDYESAETLLTEVIEQDPNCGRAYALRGRARCNAIMGKDEEAIKDLYKAIGLGEKNSYTYEYLARLHYNRKETKEATAALEDSLKVQPEQRETWQFLGAIYTEQGNQQKALECYNMAVKVDSNDAQPYFIRAQFLQGMKRYEDALKDYQMVVKIEPPREKVPRKGAALKLQAEILSQLGRHKEAIAVLDDAIGFDKTDDDLLRLRGLEYASLKKYDKAIADYSAAIDMSPEFARKTYEARSKAYASIGKTKLAQEDLAEAKRLNDKPAEKPIFELR